MEAFRDWTVDGASDIRTRNHNTRRDDLKGEADVVFKKVVTAASAVALMAAPTVAAAQSTIEPASESVEGSELRGGFIIPLIAIVAIILGILAATHDDGDPPESP
jgi:hypothetical protein